MAVAPRVIIIAGPNGAGHAIPQDVIRRRFTAGRQNFDGIYRSAVDEWVLIDNAGDEPQLLDSGGN